MTTFGQIGRDPQKGKNGFSRFKGFTLPELMVVLTLVAIITSFALPSYRTVIEKRHVTSGAVQLAAFLSAIQMEAVKRSENIAVKYDMDDRSNWCIGLVSGTVECDCMVTDPTEDDACVIDSQLRVFTNANLNYPGVMKEMKGDNSFVYDPARGLMLDHTDAVELELLSEDETYALNVQVSATGRLKICSGDSSKKVPGYKLCS